MSSPVALLFEQELTRRGVPFRIESETERYVIEHRGLRLFVSLENVSREFARDGDAGHVTKFVDSVLNPSSECRTWEEVRKSILFCFEPTDHVDRPEFRTSISDRVDRVPVEFDAAHGTISWILPTTLRDWQKSSEDVEAEALKNLAAELISASIEYTDIDGVRLGYLGSRIPFKSALILAPNLRDIVSPILGWPLNAVIPDRDFLYLWDARHNLWDGQHPSVAKRVGGAVAIEFNEAPYPLTTEVFEITDDRIKAVGALVSRPPEHS
jgi:hypothetical protein